MEGNSSSMIQQRQVPEQPVIFNNVSHTHKNPDLLLDMSGILFKPMPTEISLPPHRTQSRLHEAHMRDTVIISMDTLPLASLPQLLSTPQASGIPPAIQARSTAHTHKSSMSLWGETLCYTLAATIIIIIYMIVPLMTAFIPLLSSTWSRLLISLEILTVIEFVVFCILRRTVRR